MSINNNNDTRDDEFFLNFGSSSNVSDQLRHSIRQEVANIDASIVKMEDESHKEDRISQDMARSLAHSRNEMFNLRRFALDVVDSTQMNDMLRARMVQDLYTELLRQYLLKEDKKLANEELVEDKHLPSPTSATFLEDRHKEIKELLASCSKSKDETISVLDEKRALQTAFVSNERHRETENLEEKLKIAEMQVQEASDELENEKRQYKIANDEIHDARTKSGMYAQQIANYTKQLTSEKAKHEKERNKLADLLAKEEEEWLQLKAADNVERKVRDASLAVELLTEQLAVASTARLRRAEMQQSCASTEEEVSTLNEEMSKIKDEIAKRGEDVAVARQRQQEVKSFGEQVQALKVHNDCVEMENIMPGQKELGDLRKTEDLLVMEINDIHSTMETALKELSDHVKENCVALEELDLEMQVVSRENEQAVVALAQIKEAQEELRKSTEIECRENLELAKSLDEACDAEKSRYEALITAKEQNRKQRIQECRDRSLKRRQKLDEQLEVYERAVDMIADVEQHRLELRKLEDKINHL